MAKKIRGQIEYYLDIHSSGDEELLNVYYVVTPGSPGVAYGDDNDPGDPPEPDEIEIEIYNNHEELIEVDEKTANIIIDLCFDDVKTKRSNPFDKYNDD